MRIKKQESEMLIKNIRPFYEKILSHVSEGICCLDNDRNIVYFNKAAEDITGFKEKDIINSHCYDNIFMHVDENGKQLCKTRHCPAIQAISTGKENLQDAIFLHHKSGHRIAVNLKTSPLRDDDNNIVGVMKIFNHANPTSETQRQIKHLKKISMIDTLTNLGNRRFGELELDVSLNQFKRYDWLFGIIFFDIDDFKLINDSFGHSIGDDILKMVAKTIQEATRPFDRIIRWGGDEFLIIIVNINENSLKTIAEKLRGLVEQSFIELNGEKISPTISIGATLAKKHDTIPTIIDRVDSLMYQSKNAGQNKVTFG